jgi:hypothetical protein
MGSGYRRFFLNPTVGYCRVKALYDVLNVVGGEMGYQLLTIPDVFTLSVCHGVEPGCLRPFYHTKTSCNHDLLVMI